MLSALACPIPAAGTCNKAASELHSDLGSRVHKPPSSLDASNSRHCSVNTSSIGSGSGSCSIAAAAHKRATGDNSSSIQSELASLAPQQQQQQPQPPQQQLLLPGRSSLSSNSSSGFQGGLPGCLPPQHLQQPLPMSSPAFGLLQGVHMPATCAGHNGSSGSSNRSWASCMATASSVAGYSEGLLVAGAAPPGPAVADQPAARAGFGMASASVPAAAAALHLAAGSTQMTQAEVLRAGSSVMTSAGNPSAAAQGKVPDLTALHVHDCFASVLSSVAPFAQTGTNLLCML